MIPRPPHRKDHHQGAHQSIASSAKETPKGTRLDLTLYLYPDEHSNIHADGASGLMQDDPLELLQTPATLLRPVRFPDDTRYGGRAKE